MKKFTLSIYLAILAVAVVACDVHACRFWAAVGDQIPQSFVVDQLLLEQQSLKNLGHEYKDGWSVGFYQGNSLDILRSDKASNADKEYDNAVYAASKAEAEIVVGHLRRASSGCVKGVVNPHPFVRELNGKQWIFGHNGGMKKEVLIDLIDDDYLQAHPPKVCDDNPPKSWVDSELYFIFLLKHIELAQGNVEAGLIRALGELYDAIPDEHRYLNFFLSDGESIWAFRKGTSLHYLEKSGLAVVSSTVPDKGYKWVEFPENALAKLDKAEGIKIIHIVKE